MRCGRNNKVDDRGAASISRTDFRGSETIKITGLLPRGTDKPSAHLHSQFRRLADAVTQSDFEQMSEQVAV